MVALRSNVRDQENNGGRVRLIMASRGLELPYNYSAAARGQSDEVLLEEAMNVRVFKRY